MDEARTTATAGYAVRTVSTRYRRYALGLLTVIYALGFLDRQVINILAEDIKHELGLSDAQLGALTGLAFALFYTTLGVPIARLAERYNRSLIISAALVLWSGFTALGAGAQSFLQLFLARVGVGVGEAGCNPPAHSLISDHAPRAGRGLALGVYNLGNPIGSLSGLALGGLIADLYGWRTALLVAGLPGLAVALLAVTTLKDPRAPRSAEQLRAETPDFAAALRELAGKRTFWLIAGGAALLAFVNYGKVAFYGSFFLRNHRPELEAMGAALESATGWSLGPIALIGLTFGLITGLCGGAGTLAGGWLADRFGRADLRRYLTIPAAGAVLQFPFLAGALLSSSATAAFVLLAFPAFLTALWYGPAQALVQGLVQPRTRNTAAAVAQLVINVVGLALGPVIVGLLSDSYLRTLGDPGESLRWALVTCSVCGPLGGLLFWLGRNSVARETVS